MYEVTCVNRESNASFIKVFYDYNEMRKFVTKCKYSRKITVSGWFKYF